MTSQQQKTNPQPWPHPPNRDDLDAIAEFNARWGERFDALRHHLDPAWRSYRTGIDAAVRARVETFLPIVPYIRGLARLGCRLLPHSSWLPRALRLRQAHLAPTPVEGGSQSMLDLWRMLPEHLAGSPLVPAAAPEALFCALADPQHFGAGIARYPRQLERIARCVQTVPHNPCSIVDLGCGIGLGTLEIADTVRSCTERVCRIVGLTREPLEAWMATHRRAPHDPGRQAALRLFSRDLPVRFLTADATRVPLRLRADLIVCNGLIGGDAFHTMQQYEDLLHECSGALRDGGCLFAANRFHDGMQSRIEQFADLARSRHWHVTGSTRDLILAPRIRAVAGPP